MGGQSQRRTLREPPDRLERSTRTKRPLTALSLALVCASLPLAARAADSFAGITLGEPAADVAVLRGAAPTAVHSTDRGHAFVWTGGAGALTLTVNDDARVQAIDITPATAPAPPLTIPVDGHDRALGFGKLTDAQTDVAFAAVLDYGSANARALRLSPTLECVLFFNEKTHLLERVVFGARGTLVALGFIADDPLTKAFAYAAPTIKRTKLKDYTGDDKRRLVARLRLDDRGIVRAVDVAIPSGDPAADARATAQLHDDSYARAMLGARPIGATVFREVVPN